MSSGASAFAMRERGAQEATLQMGRIDAKDLSRLPTRRLQRPSRQVGAATVVEAMLEDETPVAWTALPRDAIVVGADGSELGRVKYVLGDQPEDIFHGIAMRRAKDGLTVEVPRTRIKRMTEEHVLTDMYPDDVASLPLYHGD